MVVSAVASVHEEVEERTSENYQPRQPPEQMGPMLGNQVKGADGQKSP
jgi:hypothetical protein|tara:strand:- start:274 stop:417 length:144 start_codon:yes stop_codon:yes gene_type:complete